MKPMLLKDYDGRNPTGLWISEKFDGVRAVWTGKELLTRAGNRIDCPAWFTQGLPPVPLDGELWAGRGNFQVAKGLCQSKGWSREWQCAQLAFFDAPSGLPIEARRMFLTALKLPAHCWPVFNFQVETLAQLEREFEDIKARGGEGLIAKLPRSPYLFGQRSAYWMKIKRSPSLYKAAA